MPDERWKLSSFSSASAGVLPLHHSPANHTPRRSAHSTISPRHTSGEALALTFVPVASTSIRPLGASAHKLAGEVPPSVPVPAVGP